MKKEMLINVSQPEECRIAIIEDGLLEELYIERASQDNYVGNIYKGRIVNLEPSIQAAFVDFGVGRNGFLHISDVEPQYFRQGGFDPDEPGAFGGGRMADIDVGEDENGGDDHHDDDEDDEAPRPRQRRNDRGGRGGGDRGRGRRPRPGARPRVKPPIQDIFQRGDEVLVQVIKEGIGSKGPTLSTYISIPGRYLVLMPALGRVGVSRKIEDDQVRRELRDIMLDLNPPKGLGFIVRTAGQDRTKKELSRDMAYLLRLWKVIVRRLKKTPGPCDIYEESDMIIRTIRDIFTSDIDSIYIDEPAAYERAKEFLQLVMPRHVHHLHPYEGREPLFHKYHLESEIANIHNRKVHLKNGGSIVIDQTEALVAIDVNSGNFRSADNNAEETAYQLNLLAAKEIARQLRLRDLGGVIVNDFIDMRKERHRRNVERALRDAMKRDRARTKILRTSPFGLIEMTRQRIRPSLKRSVYSDCPCCTGRGMVKTAESMAIEVVRLIHLAAHQPRIAKVSVKVNDEVAAYLNNKKRREITRLEDEAQVNVQILGSASYFPEHLEFELADADGKAIEMPGM
jgi:ribonuclease E